MTLKGIIQTPEEEDEYYRNRGPIPPFQNEYGCIQDVVGYAALFEGKNPPYKKRWRHVDPKNIFPQILIGSKNIKKIICLQQ